MEAAKGVFSADELKEVEIGDNNEVLLYLPAPSRKELAESLLDADGNGFIQRLILQFKLMDRLTPAIDKLFDSCRQ